MNYIAWRKRATVVEIGSDFTTCEAIYLFHTLYFNILNWQMLQHNALSEDDVAQFSINLLQLTLSGETCWFGAKSRLGMWCLTTPAAVYLISFEILKTIYGNYGLWVYVVKNPVWDQYPGQIIAQTPQQNLSHILSSMYFKSQSQIFKANHLCFVCFLHRRLGVAGRDSATHFKSAKHDL
jgi:hypothetical protein